MALGGHAGGENGGLSGFAPFQAAAGKTGKVLSQYRDLPMPIIILSQCLWKNTAHSGGREGVCAVFSALACKLVTLGPPAQEGGAGPSDVPGGKGALQANHGEGMCGPLPGPKERGGS